MSTQQKLNHLRRDYLPTDEDGQFNWGGNFNEEIQGRIGSALNMPSTERQNLAKAFKILSDARIGKDNALDLYRERVKNCLEAAWSTTEITLRPFTAKTSPTSNEIATAGFFQLAVPIADRILGLAQCTAEMKAALRLNPLPKPAPPAGRPQCVADIEDSQLTVKLVKGRFQYFIVKIDHATGGFDAEHTIHETKAPLKDPTPLPTGPAKIWKVQVTGFVKGNPVGIPGDIIDIAAKSGVAEHSEGAA